MVAKILETFFRYKLLILLPAILVPLVVTPVVLLTTPTRYEAGANIWVEQPSFAANKDDSERYMTPAQIQTGRLNELLHTRAFQIDVARRTALAPMLNSSTGEASVRAMFDRDFSARAGGSRLIALRFRAATPEAAFQVVSATIQVFQDRTAADRTAEASLATSFYEGRAQEAQEELAKSSAAIRRYMTRHPDLGERSPGRADLPLWVIDPELAALQNKVQFNQQELDRARGALQQAQQNAAAAAESSDAGFQVVDPPTVPMLPTPDTKRLISLPLAGLAGGLAISVALLIALAATDRSLRTAADLPPGVRLLGSIPRLTDKRIPKRAGPDAFRRVVGFPAGASVPALDKAH